MKKGCGRHWMNGVCYKPGDAVECPEADLGSALDKFERVGPGDAPAPARVAVVIEPLGGGWFNVKNGATGVKLNDKPMRKAEAWATAGIPLTEGETHEEEAPAE